MVTVGDVKLQLHTVNFNYITYKCDTYFLESIKD